MSKKQTKVVKTAAFMLIFACLASLFVGCGKPDEGEFIATVEELLVLSDKVNALCFGEGLVPDEEGYSSGAYREATKESLTLFGVNSTADIRALTRAVYSVVTAEWIESVVFSAVYEGGTVISYSRYYDTVVSEKEGDRAALMVKKDYDPLLSGRATYGNIRVVSLKSRRAEILVDVTVTKDGESRREKDVSLKLRNEEDGWRFDEATYFNYEQ